MLSFGVGGGIHLFMLGPLDDWMRPLHTIEDYLLCSESTDLNDNLI